MTRVPNADPAMAIRDVARLAGVSVGTVSNVLNHPHKVSSSTSIRVRKAIEELRNEAARQLRSRTSLGFGSPVQADATELWQAKERVRLLEHENEILRRALANLQYTSRTTLLPQSDK